MKRGFWFSYGAGLFLAFSLTMTMMSSCHQPSNTTVSTSKAIVDDHYSLRLVADPVLTLDGSSKMWLTQSSFQLCVHEGTPGRRCSNPYRYLNQQVQDGPLQDLTFTAAPINLDDPKPEQQKAVEKYLASSPHSSVYR